VKKGKKAVLNFARQILKTEANGVQALAKNLGSEFYAAIELLLGCKGRVVITGMGKPGFIARKIAATLSSTGTPSVFLHPAEAIHGDLGMLRKSDVVLAISNSGETEEIVKLISTLKKIGVPIIAMTSNKKSPLAENADVVLNLGITQEACPLNLAPSTSTTVSLAMGDALALCLIELKGFREEDFALLHPGGSLGRKLLKVKDIMRTGKSTAVVRENVTLDKALLAITKARAGSCVVVNDKKQLVGIFTDGDLRRHFRAGGSNDILKKPIKQFATKNPLHVEGDRLAAEALHLLKSKNIDELPVVNKVKNVVGVLDVQDLLRAGFV
jgi:arabinose-5-phosphate isomerase